MASKNRLAMYGVIGTMVLSIAINGTLLLMGESAHDKLWDMAQLCLIGILGLLKNTEEGGRRQADGSTSVTVTNTAEDPVPTTESIPPKRK